MFYDARFDFDGFAADGAEDEVRVEDAGLLGKYREVLPAPKLLEKRAGRWALKYHADALRIEAFKRRDRRSLKFNSATACHRQPRIEKDPVSGELFYQDYSISYSPSLHRAFYHNQFQCGSPWQCPVCAEKISVRRQQELRQAMEVARGKGFKPFLITLTIRHGAGDDLIDILSKIKKAFKYLTSGRFAKEVKDKIGYIGQVKSLEVTYGQNGWHPHFHILLFINDPLITEDLLYLLYVHRWIKCCVKVGLPKPDPEHAVKVQDGSHAEEYVAKFGIAHEMTGSINKKGRKVGRTPWELLDDSSRGDKMAGELFLTYADAFFNSRQLVWSRGLRSKLALDDEQSDQDIVNEIEDVAAIYLLNISSSALEVINDYQLHGKLLEVAEENPTPEHVYNYLKSAVDVYYIERGIKQKDPKSVAKQKRRDHTRRVLTRIHEEGCYYD